jgi:hypothetical protein
MMSLRHTCQCNWPTKTFVIARPGQARRGQERPQV